MKVRITEATYIHKEKERQAGPNSNSQGQTERIAFERIQMYLHSTYRKETIQGFLKSLDHVLMKASAVLALLKERLMCKVKRNFWSNRIPKSIEMNVRFPRLCESMKYSILNRRGEIINV